MIMWEDIIKAKRFDRDILTGVVLDFSGDEVIFTAIFLQKVLVEYIVRAKAAGLGRKLQYANSIVGAEDHNSLGALKNWVGSILVKAGYTKDEISAKGKVRYVI